MGVLKKCSNYSSSSNGGAGKKGRLTVYVGPEKQGFTVKTECANHPLFAMLLEEAASEYGYQSNGPIVLPNCDVDLFCKVVAEMDAKAAADCCDYDTQKGGFGKKAKYYYLTRWSRRLMMNRRTRDINVDYCLLTSF